MPFVADQIFAYGTHALATLLLRSEFGWPQKAQKSQSKTQRYKPERKLSVFFVVLVPFVADQIFAYGTHVLATLLLRSELVGHRKHRSHKAIRRVTSQREHRRFFLWFLCRLWLNSPQTTFLAKPNDRLD